MRAERSEGVGHVAVKGGGCKGRGVVGWGVDADADPERLRDAVSEEGRVGEE